MRLTGASFCLVSTTALCATLALTATVAHAQAALEVPTPSPKARVEQRVGIADVAIDYSSPGVKGRKIWGAIVPFDKPWRTGANASTKLTVSQPFLFGDKTVPAGAYALYTIPGKTAWTVALNTNLAVGGGTYDPKLDVARMTVKPGTANHRERMTFVFSDTTDDATRLDMEWENVQVAVPLKIDTKALMTANIDKTLNEAWRPHFIAARWTLESGGNPDQALTYIDQSIGLKPTWRNTWVRAQILAKKGRDADAITAAEKAQELGKGDNEFDYAKDDISKSLTAWKKKQS